MNPILFQSKESRDKMNENFNDALNDIPMGCAVALLVWMILVNVFIIYFIYKAMTV